MSEQDDDIDTPNYRRVYKVTVLASSRADLALDLTHLKSDDRRDILVTQIPDTFISKAKRERRVKRHGNSRVRLVHGAAGDQDSDG